jgi:hypothetical protein
MASLTGADAVIIFSGILFPVPQQLQGFGPDDVVDTPDVVSSETSMGVDGNLSGGFVFMEVPQTYTLQADSPSNDFFDLWYAANIAAKTAYTMNGLILLPSLGYKWTNTRGFLSSLPPMPSVKKLSQPRKFKVTWQSMSKSAA